MGRHVPVAVIQDRLNEASPAGADGTWGMDRSLPVGDR